jgi:hypothetical protein
VSLQQVVQPKTEGRGGVEAGRCLGIGTRPPLDDQPESIKAQRIEEGSQYEQYSGEAFDLDTSHWAWIIFLFFLFIAVAGEKPGQLGTV